jgi:hypothetical protein
MARTKTKFTTTEVYLHTYKNIEAMLQKEKDWLESGSCRDRVAQHRLVSNLECTLSVFKSYPGICRIEQ